MQNHLSKRWQVVAPISSEADRNLSRYPRYLRQILFNRGYSDLESAQKYLDADGYQTDPFLLKDMHTAVDRLLRAIDQREPVAVYGDYDVDGVTATVLLTQVLRTLGADARAYIPNRFEEGYGLNNDALDGLAAAGVKLVITVDCGIRSAPEAEHARKIGLDMIISDHHSPLDDLPPAVAVVCHRQEGDTYPDQNLAGVGLAYKIAQALFTVRPTLNRQAEDWLDLVALGTVADVVPLTGENRSLVRAGLVRIRRGLRRGLLSLMHAASLTVERCTAGEIGYVIGPRLNAAGRLESALASVDLLMADDVFLAAPLAQKLDDQNRKRQELTREMQAQAEAITQVDACDHLLCAFHPDFNSGVVGLVAARLAESYYRPAIVGQRGEEFTRASCRSIDEFHITKALDECRDLLVRHGGHAKAAGFTVRTENLDELVARLREIARRELAHLELRPVLKADMEIPLVDLRPEIFQYLDLLEPTGLDNPEAVFVSRNLRVKRCKTVGNEGSHLKLAVSDGNLTFDAIAFRQGHWVSQMPDRIDILYTYERNYYNDRVSLQLNVRDIKPSGMPD
jgi:single-stranded-DNA-specific exonuclease